MKSKKAEEYINADLNIFCCNKREWETDELEILPSGDFLDNKRRVHSKETHIPFVNYYKCVEAIHLAEEEMRQKAIEAYLNSCLHLYDRNCDISDNGMCEYRSGGKCKYMNDFIEELDNC